MEGGTRTRYPARILDEYDKNATLRSYSSFKEREKRRMRKLLKPVTTVTLKEHTEKFIAKERFIRSSFVAVLIYGFNANFRTLFLKGDGKIEYPPSAKGANIVCYKLLRNSHDNRIVRRLGGEEKAETTLCCIHQLIEKEEKEKCGVLLIDNRANIFYVRDIAGILRPVCVRRYSGGWYIAAGYFEDPSRWRKRNRVFSHNEIILEAQAPIESE